VVSLVPTQFYSFVWWLVWVVFFFAVCFLKRSYSFFAGPVRVFQFMIRVCCCGKFLRVACWSSGLVRSFVVGGFLFSAWGGGFFCGFPVHERFIFERISYLLLPVFSGEAVWWWWCFHLGLFVVVGVFSVVVGFRGVGGWCLVWWFVRNRMIGGLLSMV